MQKLDEIKFEVERNGDVIMFSPEKLTVNMQVGLVRTISSEKGENTVPFKYNGVEFKPDNIISAYGRAVNVAEFMFYLKHYSRSLFIHDIDGFSFDGLADKSKLTVMLYELKPMNLSRKLLSHNK